jgi:Uma2 family endonuclease
MSTVTARRVRKASPPANLIEEDGVPLESDWHRLAMTLLLELVNLHFLGREDYFAGGNMFIYFNARQARDRDFRGPDFFFVWDAPLNPPRKYWAVWEEEGRYPDVIIELSSPTTAAEDRGIKKKTYERIFKTSEYFLYDPDGTNLQGWRLNGKQRFQEISPNEKGWLWSNQLGLWIGLWKGKYQGKRGTFLRFFDKDGKIVGTALERLDAAQAEVARLKAKTKGAGA